MIKKFPTIIFFGNERLATGVTTSAPTLRSLVEAGHNIAAIVINHEKARSRSSRDPEIVSVAEAHNIPVWYYKNDTDINQKIKAANPSVGVLVAYGKIVSSETINLFPAGIVNIHPSLLPKHRGPTPIESVILSGENKTGVSLMSLVKQMDAGPIYAQRIISVPRNYTKQELTDKLLIAGSELLLLHLSDIINNKLIAKSQNDQLATYDKLIDKKDGLIDWSKPADQLFREVIAYAKWPKSTATIGAYRVIISAAGVVNTSGVSGEYTATKSSLVVYAGDNALSINRLQPENKKAMSVSEFLAGYKL